MPLSTHLFDCLRNEGDAVAYAESFPFRGSDVSDR